MPRVIIRPKAEDDLEDIFNYIAEQNGTRRASNVLRKIYNTMKVYAHQPNAGRRRDELSEGLRSFPVFVM